MILEAYIKTIKVLKKLDSSGILLEMIAEIINKYLSLATRQRSDTLRSIVEIVIHDEDHDLQNQLG